MLVETPISTWQASRQGRNMGVYANIQNGQSHSVPDGTGFVGGSVFYQHFVSTRQACVSLRDLTGSANLLGQEVDSSEIASLTLAMTAVAIES
jgi:hypothetical protein